MNDMVTKELGSSPSTDTFKCDTDVERLLKYVQNVKKASANTIKILNPIFDIVLQINVLTLQAYIEAARAGHKEGEGFTAVAEKLRTFCNLCHTWETEASKEIFQLLEAINELQLNDLTVNNMDTDIWCSGSK